MEVATGLKAMEYMGKAIEAVEKEVMREVTVNELQSDIEKRYMNLGTNIVDVADYKLTLEDISDKRNKYLLENIKVATENPEVRRAVLNNLENNCKLNGDTGEYFASKNLNRLGNFERSFFNELDGRTNIIDFACLDGLKENASFQALKVSEDGMSIGIEKTYIPKEKSLAVEIKNGLSEINNRKHLKEQLEAGKDLCEKSFLGINKGMAEEMINNPEKYIKAINDLKTKCDEIVVLMPDRKTQISKIGGMDLSGYSIC